MSKKQVTGPTELELVAEFGYDIGDRVIERTGPHGAAVKVPTVIIERSGRYVRTKTGHWYDAITGMIDRRFGEVGYQAIHSADYVCKLPGGLLS